MKQKVLITASAIFLFAVISAFTISRIQKDPWPVPEKYLKMANPVKADAESLKEGKALWAKHCQSCHGKAGMGDGPKASQLKTDPGDFSKPDFQKQPDGALFYKTQEGRDDMPSFKKKIPDEDDIWNLVNYMRTLKK